MKNYLKLKSVAVVTLLLVINAGCSSDSSPSSNQNTINAVIASAKTGTWRITYFYDTDHEETSNYTGLNFTFGNNSVLTAQNSSSTYTGSWSVTSSSSSSNDDIDFNILFSAPAFMEELSDDWHIISYSATEIELIDVSGGNGGTDYLTFTKN